MNDLAVSAPSNLISAALSANADLDKLKGLLELQERWEANEAKKAYVAAMASFKADPPEIDKDKTVSYGNTKYNHASLANVTAKINSSLSKHGLSAAWSTKQVDTGITVTCTITHNMGHSESTSLTAEPDNSGQKNKIQAIGSTITYLERYTILALTGLATHEQDDDGNGVGATYITEEQQNELHAMITERCTTGYLATFERYIASQGWGDSIETVPAKHYQTVKASLELAIKKHIAANAK